jgi:histidyl-tRNA synthetase
MEMRAPKGSFDIYPDAKERWQDTVYWHHAENVFRHLASVYNFKEIRTPMFEHLELFQKGVGEGSDIVSKEMYNFLDKGGRELALRPEGTAGVIRAYVENRLYTSSKSSKLYYIAPMFRYERQQSGRYRQFHQFGAESIGLSSPLADVEIIELAWTLYKKLGLQNLQLFINCVGDHESRKAYTQALKDFLDPKFNELSSDSKIRYQKNMLRILDSKDLADQKLLEGCPNILEFLDDNRRAHFETVLKKLDELGIKYQVDPKLVRGLDYYDSTVFEIIAMKDHERGLTIGGGGRYDGLIESYSGPKTPAVGFGTGVERIIQTLIEQEANISLSTPLVAYIIPLEESQHQLAYILAHTLRSHDIACDVDLTGRKLKASLPYASSQGAEFALILGEDEMKDGKIKIKNLLTRQEENVDKNSVINFLSKNKS